MSEKEEKPKPDIGYRWVASVIATMAGIWFLSLLLYSPQPSVEEIAYSEFKDYLAAGQIAEVALKGSRIDAVPVDSHKQSEDEDVKQATRLRTYVPAFGDPTLLPQLEERSILIKIAPPDDDADSSWLWAFLPILLIVMLYVWIFSRLSQASSGPFAGGVDEFLSGSSQKTEAERPKISFDDVAGQDNAKREIAEVVQFLQQPERFKRLGAEAPRGVLLMGPPGTGKTLLARALAGEAGVPFFNISGSEFVEVFVGVGASRVRRMFEEAKKRAPCIIFIDELDSIGRVRGSGLGGGNDEREQTLNQILSEMDGFSGHEAVVVLAATNRPDVLDPALLRPGRFDRHVTLELPDKEARVAILEVHTRKVPLAKDVDLNAVASGTPGFSGADLKNLVNESAIAAVQDGCSKISMAHMDAMRDKIMMGTVRTLAIQPEERHRLAVHEAGHTAVGYYLPNADPLYKVTIIPRGRSLGSTHMLPEEDRHTLPEAYLKTRLAMMLAGRAAEKELLGSVSSGADDDIRQATRLARSMVARWGMSKEVGPVDLGQTEENPFLGREFAQPRHFSEDAASKVDEAVRALLGEAHETAATIIVENKVRIERLVEQLEQHETLDRKDIEACLATRDAGEVLSMDRFVTK